VRRLVASRILLGAAFVLAHLWLGMLALYAPGQPLGDVTNVYRYWIVDYGFGGHGWVGIDTVWVYPILAILPMLAAAAFGGDLYASTWLSLVMVVDAVAFVVLVVRGRRLGSPAIAWWWLGFLVALGPVAVGRIDAITVPVAMLGMLVLATRPALAGVLLTVAAWIKVWPAALVAAAVVAVRARARVIIGAAVTTVVVLVVALALGAGTNVLSFITQQTGRGLQVEAVMATPWMWDAVHAGKGHASIYYDTAILTFQLRGEGVATAAALATPLLAVAAALLLGLGVLAARRGRTPGELLPPLALALTVALILFNKVGSPQFVTWLAVPVVFGLVTAASGEGRSFRVPAVLSVVIAAFTQLIYPFIYDDLLAANLSAVMLLSARNLLYVALFAWAVIALVDVARREPPALPAVTPSAGISWIPAATDRPSA